MDLYRGVSSYNTNRYPTASFEYTDVLSMSSEAAVNL